MPATANKKTLPDLQNTIDKLTSEFNRIPEERKVVIRQLTEFITKKTQDGEKVLLNFICTHNSRRSLISQIWAQAAAYNYGVHNVEAFSGGTEATAFNPKAVKAMKDVGFNITVFRADQNPVYRVRFAGDAGALVVFSKTYDDKFNPKGNFAAIMTCSHADENCPLVLGASARIALTYDDPKNFDGTPQEAEKYAERVREIGIEMLYAFSQVKM